MESSSVRRAWMRIREEKWNLEIFKILFEKLLTFSQIPDTNIRYTVTIFGTGDEKMIFPSAGGFDSGPNAPYPDELFGCE